MDYTLDKLGTDNFETLVQSLCLEIFGNGLKIYGNGPDGQREATFDGKSEFPAPLNGWSGYFVIQAKYKEQSTKTDDFAWLKKQFESEMAGFAEKKAKGKRIPDNYLFFTNVILTPVAETGVKDKMDALASKYKKLIPNIAIIGKDEICRYLDKYRNIALAYTSFITSGDVLASLYSAVTRRETEKFDALLRYVAHCFNEDYCSRMDQAGKITDDRVPIDKIYADLRMSEVRGDRHAVSFIKTAVDAGKKRWGFNKFAYGEYKTLREIAENRETNKFVIRGGAGQGKSTVCQFLAQIYRACFLMRHAENCGEKVEKFVKRVKSDGIELPCIPRIPIKIELRLYSAYIAEKKRAGQNYDLVTFIASEIARKSASVFDNDTLRYYLKAFPFTFFFDGLDEVSENSNRKDVMDQIDSFIGIELMLSNADCTVFATTRPEGYVGEFGSNFRHFDLLPLNEEECLVYTDKLLSALEANDDKRAEYMKILADAQKHEQIAFMMQTPLQATIRAILVRSGGEPPRDKYSLFKEYFGIILKREKQKSVQTILNDNQQLIENIYTLLGYELQKLSYVSGKSDALITYDELNRLIGGKLVSDGIKEGSEEFLRMSDEVFKTVVHRINFAAEIREGRIGFPIRSMQEYLAAVYIKNTYSDGELTPLLVSLARNAYWKNTFMFIVEGIDKEKQYFTDIILDTVLGELNGNSLPIGKSDALSSVYFGSRLAYEILVNNIFKNKPRCENKLCKHFAKFCLLTPNGDYSKISDASDYVKNELCNFILTERDAQTLQGRIAFAAVLCKQIGYYEKLKPFVKANAASVLEYYEKLNGSYENCPEELAKDGLDSSEYVFGDFEDIVSFLKVLPHCNKNAQKVVFEAVIRNCLSKPKIQAADLKKFDGYFLCDFKSLRQFYADRDDYANMYSDDSFVFDYYDLPSGLIDSERIAAVAKELGSTAVACTLKAVNSYDMNDYRAFYEYAKINGREIERLRLRLIADENPVCDFILNSLDYGKFDKIERALNSELENRLKSTKGRYFCEELAGLCKDVPLYKVFLLIGSREYEVYDGILRDYTESDIISNEGLLKFTLHCYGAIIERYNEVRAVYKKQCIDWLLQALGFVKAHKAPNSWCDDIFMFALDKLPESEYAAVSECIDRKPKRSVSLNSPKEKNYDKKYLSRCGKLMRFIELTENKSACEYLLQTVFVAPRLEDLRAVKWEKLRFADDDRFTALELLLDKEKDNTVQIESLLQGEEVISFLREVFHRLSAQELSSLKCDCLGLYVKLLEYYRNEKDKTAVNECERKINEILVQTRIAGGMLK